MAARSPDVTHHVHEQEADGSLGTYVGGANDLASAVFIACTMYAVVQEASAKSDRVILVLDDTGAAVAFVGRYPVQVSPQQAP